MRHRFLNICAAWFLLISTAASTLAQPQPGRGDLQTFTSKNYTIHTNLRREEARPFGAHMDAVFEIGRASCRERVYVLV